MSKVRTAVNTAADNWGVVITLLNNIVDDLGTEILTANTHSGGAVTVGNGYVTGIFGGTTLAANAVRGGTVSTSAPLNVTSNVAFAAAAKLTIGNIVANTTALLVGANVQITPTAMLVGNSTVNSVANSSFWGMSNSTATLQGSLANGFQVGISQLSPTSLVIGANTSLNSTALFLGNATVNTFINSAFFSIGAQVSINSTGLALGNSTVLSTVNSTVAFLGNSSFFTTLIPGTITVGNSTVNAIINSTGVSAGLQIITDLNIGNSTVNVHLNTTSIAVGANVVVNTTAYFVGNDTVFAYMTQSALAMGAVNLSNTNIAVGNSLSNVTANSTVLSVGNTTVNTTVNSSSIAIRGGLYQGVNTTTTNVVTVIDSFLLSTYQAAEYLLTVKNTAGSNQWSVSKILVIQDGGGAHYTEYGTMFSNGDIGSFSADANATHVRMLFTPNAPTANSTAIKGVVNRLGV